MSTKYATSLRLDLKPSRLFLRLAVGAHALALAASLFNALPLALRALWFVAVTLSLRHTLKQHRRACRLIEFRYSDAGGWTMLSGGDLLPVNLLPSTLSASWIVMLHYRTQTRGVQILPIFRDAVTAEQFRQLRVALRVAGNF